VTRGRVINIHLLGATVRLEDGTLAAVPADELAAHRPAFVASCEQRSWLALDIEHRGRYPRALLARGSSRDESPPAGVENRSPDAVFEERMGAYLKATEEWAPPDRPAPAERHFIRKKRRAALFEARNKPT